MSTLDFVAIDFETANRQRASACQVGLAMVRDGKIVDSQGWYIVPPTGADDFDPMNVHIHGITAKKVQAEGISWRETVDRMIPLISDLPLVAHNSPFDRSVYTRANELVGLQAPTYRWEDSVRLARRELPALENHKLHTVTDALGIEFLNHHDAFADAVACAEIVRILSEQSGGAGVDELWPSTSIRGGRGSGDAASQRIYKTTTADMPKPDLSADPTHPLFGRHVVITGELPGLSRMEMFEALALRGATPQKSFTKKTDVLIVADRGVLGPDYDPSVGTGKEKKAFAALLEGRKVLLLGGEIAARLLTTAAPFLTTTGSEAAVESTASGGSASESPLAEVIEPQRVTPDTEPDLATEPVREAEPPSSEGSCEPDGHVVVRPGVAENVTLAGTCFAASGRVEGMTRDALFALLESHGALTQPYVTSKTDVLILADRATVPADLDLSRGKTSEKQAHKLLQSGHSITVMGMNQLWEAVSAAESGSLEPVVESAASESYAQSLSSAPDVVGPAAADEPDAAAAGESMNLPKAASEGSGETDSTHPMAAEAVAEEPMEVAPDDIHAQPSIQQIPAVKSTPASPKPWLGTGLAVLGWILLAVAVIFVVATVAVTPEITADQGAGTAITGAAIMLVCEAAVVWLAIWLVRRRKRGLRE
jgi:DNA polymerase-3 subunit epsilon